MTQFLGRCKLGRTTSDEVKCEIKTKENIVRKLRIEILKFVGLAVMCTACSEDGAVQSQNVINGSQLLAEKITMNDFDNNNSVTKLSEEEMIRKIESESIFYNRKNLDKLENEFQQCISVIKKMYGVIDYQKNFEFFFQEGVKNCRKLGEQVSSEIHSQHISQWKFEPSSLALNKLHYQNIQKSTNTEFFHKYYQEKSFINGDKTIISIFESNTDNNSTACKSKNNSLSNCSFRRKKQTYIAKNQKEQNEISIFKFKDVIRSDGTHYKSGSIAFVINDWTGEVTFTNSEEIPTYTATNTEGTISGSLRNSEMENSGESAWH